MQRDLGVMEEVLRSLCEHTASRQPVWGSEPEVRGLYIEGYGALFLVEGCMSPARAAEVVVMTVQQEGTRQIVRTIGKNGAPDESTDSTNSTLEQNYQLLAEFLGSYGSAISQLRDDERITVLVRPSRNRHSFLHTTGIELPLPPVPPLPPIDVDVDVHLEQLAEGLEQLTERLNEKGVISDSLSRRIRIEVNREIAEEEEKNQKKEEILDEWIAATEVTEKARVSRVFRLAGDDSVDFRFAGGDSVVVPSHLPPLPLLTATIGKQDLTAHRRGQLTDAQFRERITFQEHDPHAPHLKTIDIMAGILDKALDGRQPRGFRAKDSTTGIYQEGLDALFFVELESAGVHLDALFSQHRQRDKAEERPDIFARVEDQLVETAADYGATLRPLKADEFLVVEVRIPRSSLLPITFGSSEESLPSRLILKARRADIDAYHQGDIDLEKFRKKVEIQEL